MLVVKYIYMKYSLDIINFYHYYWLFLITFHTLRDFRVFYFFVNSALGHFHSILARFVAISRFLRSVRSISQRAACSTRDKIELSRGAPTVPFRPLSARPFEL